MQLMFSIDLTFSIVHKTLSDELVHVLFFFIERIVRKMLKPKIIFISLSVLNILISYICVSFKIKKSRLLTISNNAKQ